MELSDVSRFMETAVVEVLEAMCFVSSEEEAAGLAVMRKENWICGELDFHGATKGRFGLAVPPLTAAAIAANFLGEDETGLTSSQTNEVIGELTNMVCGTLLAQIDSKTAFALSPPRMSVAGSDHYSCGERIDRTYSTDEGPIYMWLEMQAAA